MRDPACGLPQDKPGRFAVNATNLVFGPSTSRRFQRISLEQLVGQEQECHICVVPPLPRNI
jgi:hypothetical protein